MSDRFDLGAGVTGYWLGWRPDRSIESNRARYEGVADIERCSLVLEHVRADGSPCQGVCLIDSPTAQVVFPPPQPRWTMLSEEPLTLTPSIRCGCGWHGDVREGRWVPD